MNATYTPPTYDAATKLPSYDEAERSKAAEAGFPSQPPCPDRAARQNRRQNGPFLFWVNKAATILITVHIFLVCLYYLHVHVIILYLVASWLLV